MDQKYSPPTYSVSTINFEVFFRKKSLNQKKIRIKDRNNYPHSVRATTSKGISSFIPKNIFRVKQDLMEGLLTKKKIQPLVAKDLEPKGFPNRKSASSHSYRSIAKRDKNFNMGYADEIQHFSNKRISHVMTTSGVHNRQSTATDTMAKSSIPTYGPHRRSFSMSTQQSKRFF